MATTYYSAIQSLYVAYFNRPADYTGLQYWETVVENAKGSTTAVAAAFAASAEYKATFAGQDYATVVNKVYMNLFGRPAELAGLQYWVTQLNAGKVTIDQVVTTISGAAQGADKTAFNDKVSVAVAFTNALDTSAKITAYSSGVGTATVTQLLGTVVDDASATTALGNVSSAISQIVAIKTLADAPTYTLAQALQNAATLPAVYKLSDAIDNAGTHVTVAAASANLAAAQQIISKAANAASLSLAATYSLQDSLANIATANSAVLAGASSYALNDANINLGTNLTTAAANTGLITAQGLVKGATNSASLTLNPTYTIADTLANVAANTAIVTGHAYTLTDAAGSLGVLTTAQAALVAGATDAAQYTYQTLGTTQSLIVGPDTLTGTTGNDTFISTNTSSNVTFSAFDSVDGGAGVDTLNVIDTATAAGAGYAAPANLSIKNIENLNVTTTGSVGVAATTFDVSGYTGLTKAVFTAAGDGTTANNVRVADTTAATLIVTAGAATIIGGNVDSIVTAGTTAQSTIAGAALTSASVKGGGAATIDNVNSSSTSGAGTTLTSVTVDGNAGTVALNGTVLTNVTLKNLATAENVNITNSTATHALTLGLSAAGKAGQVITVNDANAASVAITASGTTNNAKLSTGAADTVLKTVTVAGSGALTLDLDGTNNTAVTSFDGSTATGGLTLANLATGIASVKTGSGADSFSVTQTAKIAVDTGAGNDVLNIVSAVAAGSTIALGAGNDSVTAGGGSFATSSSAASAIDGGDGVDMIAASLVNSGTAALFKNFEQLDLTSYNAAIDATLLTGSTITGLVENGAAATANTAVIQNLGASETVLVTGAIDQASLAAGNLGNLTLTQAAGASLAVNFNAAPASANTLGGYYAALGNLVTTGDKTLTINSTGGTNLTGNGIALVQDTANTLTKITITGDKAFTLGDVKQTSGSTNTSDVLTSIDGSAATGKLNITATFTGSGTFKAPVLTISGGTNDDTLTTSLASAVVNGGAGNDTITASGATATVNAGDGNDTVFASGANATVNAGDGNDMIKVISTGVSNIANVTGGLGADTLYSTLAYGTLASSTGSATTGSYASFLDAARGDVLSFATVANASGALGAIVTTSSAQTFDQAVFAADAAANAAATGANTVVWFQYGTNTYVLDNATVGNSADDVIIKLVGLIDLSGATVVTGANGTITLA